MLPLRPEATSKGISLRMTDGETHESMVPTTVIRNKALARPARGRRVPRSPNLTRKPCQTSKGTIGRIHRAGSVAGGKLANTLARARVIFGTYSRLGAHPSLGVRKLT